MDKQALTEMAIKLKEENLIRLGEKYKNAELDLFLFRIELEREAAKSSNVEKV